MSALNGTCGRCGSRVELEKRDGRFTTSHTCGKAGPEASHVPPPEPRDGPVDRRKSPPSRAPWSAAKPTTCAAGHRHASGMEARVCERLTRECEASGTRLLQQVRFPLLVLDGKPSGRANSVTVDFVVVERDGSFRAIDAKSRRVSRDWPLRAAAFATTYGQRIEETSK